MYAIFYSKFKRNKTKNNKNSLQFNNTKLWIELFLKRRSRL